MNFFKRLAIVLLLTSVFTACKKDKDESLAVTKDNLAGTYTVTSIKVKENSNAEVDGTAEYFDEACESDDQYVLRANGTNDRIDAGTTCSSSTSYTGDMWVLEGPVRISWRNAY